MELKGRDPRLASTEARGRIIVVFSSIGSVPVFGLVLWILIGGTEAGLAPFSAEQSRLVLWTGFMWAWVSAIAIAVQGWIARERIGDLVGPNFGRVLLLIQIPLSLAVFGLILALQILSKIESSSSLGASQVDAVVIATTLDAVCALFLPAATVFSNRVRNLVAPRNLHRSIMLIEIGLLPFIAGFVWAVLQILSL